jgi:hypothetical protein
MMKPKKNPVTKLVAAGAKAIVKARSPKLSKLAKNYDNALKVRAGKAPESKIEKRAIKAAQGKSLAPKKYKPDTEGRKQVKRFAAPLEKANGKKTSMRMAAQTIDIGRSSLKIKPAPKNRGK